MSASPTKSKRRAAKAGRHETESSSAGASAAPFVAPTGGVLAPHGDVPWLTIRGASANNLKSVEARFPLGRFTCVTGVSGSGKSTLVNEILYAALARDLNGATAVVPGKHAGIDGKENLDKIIAIDQTPIGRTPRSNPATYIKLFDEIRDLYTKLPDSKLRGYKAGRFSFNVAMMRGGGRCEACEGNGANRIEMDFLADVWVTCPVCEGRRFTAETLRMQFKGKSIAQVLEMDVQQALEHFESQPRIRAMLQTLHDVGLDYIKIGQPSPTLSGGEAQRIKLARELVKKATGRTIYVLDEPTTGLHFEDIRRLLTVLHGFVDAGNTVVVIEHNLDVIKTADWILDLGPEGGQAGGQIVAEGAPEVVARHAGSHTGAALAAVLWPQEPSRVARELRRAAGGSGQRGGAARPDPFDAAAQAITVAGARQHNLKDLTISFPRNQTTVCTGVSGSGKTSFAIDTVFAEGYRRYVESLSAYARQFLGQLAKPRVEHVSGLSPAICIEQKAASKSPRSTVGTITEIYDYMRVLWARVGSPRCVKCDGPVGSQTVDEIIARIMELEAGAPIMVLSPLKLGDGESWATVINRLKASGYQRVRVDGAVVDVMTAATLDAKRRHRVEVVIDRTMVRDKSRGRIVESVEHALALGNGVMTLLVEAFETVDEDPPPETVSDNANAPDGAALAETPRVAKSRKRPERHITFSQRLACTRCGISYEELGPHQFSFNSQLGWCETCEGLGVQRGAPASQIIVNPSRSILNGAVAGWDDIARGSKFGKLLTALCRSLDVDVDAPLQDWSAEQKQALMYGSGAESIDAGGAFAGVRFRWRGFFPTLDAATRNSWSARMRLRNVVADIPCTDCRGGRLRPDSAAVRLAGKSIVDVCALPLRDSAAFFETIKLDPRERRIAGELLLEIRNRLRFLLDVGLDYLHLHRAAPTLSGGEAQRIRLASQIGSGLTGVLYVLDEPTIGLHPRDNARLIRAIDKLRDLGNTLLLVEHDREVIASADRLIDFGPRAGKAGGRVVAEGAPKELATGRKRQPAAEPDESFTRGYLNGELAIPIPENRRPIEFPGWPALQSAIAAAPKKRAGGGAPSMRLFPGWKPPVSTASGENWLVLRGAAHNNLKRIDAPIPLGRLTCITGVSGSGKSSLVNDILWPAAANRLNRANQTVGEHVDIRGMEQIDKVINVDQDPIGFTPASNAATYTGVFDLIRELYARLPESKVRGWTANRFSFNRPGGRCEACEGNGQKKVEMHFMADVWIECESCGGRRYSRETQEVKFRGRSIADVLDLSAGEALTLFESVPKVRRLLQTLVDVGVDYVSLGQSATTLSGGEAQRVKLAAELGKPDTGRTLYILDEPSTGLHFDDVQKLLNVLQRLVDLGNTVVVVEHHLDLIKSADWIIELGPEAGDQGGYLVAAGSPEELVAGTAVERAKEGRTASIGALRCHTAEALAPVLAAGPRAKRAVFDPMVHAAEMLAMEKAGYGDVGKEVKQPWQVDGRKWHLEQRASRCETPRQWRPEALEYVIELVQKAGRFSPTNWNNRASIEITAAGAPKWFMHALTGGEWLIEFYFLAPAGMFTSAKLNAELGLKTLDQRDDIQSYGDWARVDVRKRQGGIDAIAIYVHDKNEVDTPAFRRFIKTAAKAYFEKVVEE